MPKTLPDSELNSGLLKQIEHDLKKIGKAKSEEEKSHSIEKLKTLLELVAEDKAADSLINGTGCADLLSLVCRSGNLEIVKFVTDKIENSPTYKLALGQAFKDPCLNAVEIVMKFLEEKYALTQGSEEEMSLSYSKTSSENNLEELELEVDKTFYRPSTNDPLTTLIPLSSASAKLQKKKVENQK